MLLSLGIAGLALRSGLALRRSRRLRAPRPRELRPSHLRFAKLAVVLLMLGAVLGPASSLWLRDWTPLRSLHGVLGVAVAGLLGAAAIVGHRIEEGKSRSFDVHAWLGLAAFLLAAVASVAGFVLLP
jgi:hypothetical protein